MVVGGVTFTDLENLLQLTAYAQGTGATNATFRLTSGSAGYQVPVGKSLYILAVRTIHIDTAVAASATQSFNAQLCYADNDVGQASATAFTNQVYIGGSAIHAAIGSKMQIAEPGMVKWEAGIKWVIPAQKYAGFVQNAVAGTCLVHAFGYVK